MNRLIANRRHASILCTAILAGGLSGPGIAQTGADPGRAVGTGAVTGFVEDMDRSLAFYHDVFGMEVPALPETGMRPYNPSNAQLFAMFDIHGARERHQHAQVPGTSIGFELMEVQDVDFRTIPLRLQDPGAMTLVFTVDDLAPLLDRIRQHQVEIVTEGGAPVGFADGSRALLIRDIDGRYIELRQPPAAGSGTAAAGTGAITEMRLSIAVADLTSAVGLYRDVLDFSELPDLRAGAGAETSLRALTGLPTAEFRRGVVRGPGDSMIIEFVEYGNVDRQPLRMRIQDRGAARMQIRAENLDALVARMKTAGFTVVSEGGGAVPIPPNFLGALVADPNNFFLTPFAPCDGCAPRLVSESD